MWYEQYCRNLGEAVGPAKRRPKPFRIMTASRKSMKETPYGKRALKLVPFYSPPFSRADHSYQVIAQIVSYFGAKIAIHSREAVMNTCAINEQIILSVFTADDQAKVRALDILQGKETKLALSGPLLLGMGGSRRVAWSKQGDALEDD